MSFKNIIRANAEAIVDLHRRTKETLENRDKGEQEEQLWQEAFEEFHSRHSELTFPGGSISHEKGYDRKKAKLSLTLWTSLR